MRSAAKICLLANLVLSAHALPKIQPDSSPAAEGDGITEGHSLEMGLASGGVEEPGTLSALLVELGLHSAQDLRRLNELEQLELAECLKHAGVSLGSRSKLRSWAAADTTRVARGHSLDIPTARAKIWRRVQDQPSSAATSSGGGVSVETIAIAVTVLLGLASYILQAKLARDHIHSEKEHDRYIEGRDKEHRQAALQLDRVRSQLADALFPTMMLFKLADYAQSRLQWRLKLPIAETLLKHKLFIRPMPLWSHVEVAQADVADPEIPRMSSACALIAYGPDDLAHLNADESKRDLFVDTYRYSIVPRMRAAADLMLQTRHLLDYPSSTDILKGQFAASGIDWDKLFWGQLSVAGLFYIEHIDAWTAITSRWERGEFSIMFPAAPDFFSVLHFVWIVMMGVAGQLEQKLQGVSAGSNIQSMFDGIYGEQDDST
jgi:hypothetical protein